ncbi:hypothetical protein ACK1CN_16330 [Vibrio coralliilyticus]|uniref:Uncharacterized protein n=1 Tax=Vibrio coralliilyticus TaxID=190893 RepID=A0AAN0SHE0_9VIBR|nr:hypothetical protein [Vibrio coralliilyticus]AIW21180.1 hypothetical protein IX92_19320 [Vibrio coralliilyticus]NOH39391.1 hypothetical protein [Vibrio coralliilyticus]NRF25121.1 hypothetical protein [Vibrio coralliilyticus]NRF79379.1 hypothetical protein [Vibrio coralliilyticus]
MQLVVISIVLIASLAISVLIQTQQADSVFNSTRWICSERKSHFLRGSFSQYSEIDETHTLLFTSDDMMTQYHSGQIHIHGEKPRSFEVNYTTHYTLSGNRLRMLYDKIMWVNKPSGVDVFVNSINRLEGMSIDINYYIEGSYLYLFNNTQSEDSNFVCHAA